MVIKLKNRIDLDKYQVRTDLIIENSFLNSDNLKVRDVNDDIISQNRKGLRRQ